MIGVNHINVIKVCRCSLIGKIYGVFERKIPDREGFKLCVARLVAPLIFMIKL